MSHEMGDFVREGGDIHITIINELVRKRKRKRKRNITWGGPGGLHHL
jgi:hypothetical protein